MKIIMSKGGRQQMGNLGIPVEIQSKEKNHLIHKKRKLKVVSSLGRDAQTH